MVAVGSQLPLPVALFFIASSFPTVSVGSLRLTGLQGQQRHLSTGPCVSRQVQEGIKEAYARTGSLKPQKLRKHASFQPVRTGSKKSI